MYKDCIQKKDIAKKLRIDLNTVTRTIYRQSMKGDKLFETGKPKTSVYIFKKEHINWLKSH